MNIALIFATQLLTYTKTKICSQFVGKDLFLGYVS